jgi:hypothetical protein
MPSIRVRAASRLWYRLDATARTAAHVYLRWRSSLAPLLPF